MKTTVEGIYKEGKVTLKESVPYGENAKVLVVFLEDDRTMAFRKEKLMNLIGSWEDNRDAETIIAEIYGDRVSSKDDIEL